MIEITPTDGYINIFFVSHRNSYAFIDFRTELFSYRYYHYYVTT